MSLKIALVYPQMGDAMMVLGGHDDHGVVPMDSEEVLLPGMQQVCKHLTVPTRACWNFPEMLTVSKDRRFWSC